MNSGGPCTWARPIVGHKVWFFGVGIFTQFEDQAGSQRCANVAGVEYKHQHQDKGSPQWCEHMLQDRVHNQAIS